MRIAFALLGVALSAGCRCGTQVQQVASSLSALPSAVNFGSVRVGTTATQSFKLKSVGSAPVTVKSLTFAAPGTVFAFTGTLPTSVDGEVTVTLSFSPVNVEAYTAKVVVDSSDPERPTFEIPVEGVGALPVIEVTTECASARKCAGTASQTPLGITFAPEPLVRLLPTEVTALPNVVLVNAGEVPLVLSSIVISNGDVAAFTIEGNAAVPVGGLSLQPGEGLNVPIRFKPTLQNQSAYASELHIASDDPDKPLVKVALAGALRPNLPPVICANVVRVTPDPADGAPRDWGTPADWAPLKAVPDAGYDFATTRDVVPRAQVELSATSDATKVTECTFDPEDGRMGLVYAWTLEQFPPGASSLPLAGAGTDKARLTPLLSGNYEVRLKVTDSQGASTATTVRFAVAIKQDFVAQLSWPGFNQIDLDLHLVRPSASPADAGDAFEGVYASFQGPPAGKTSGDMNGFANKARRDNVGLGFDFDWGAVGTADDPRISFDDLGGGGLIESIAMNEPENDALCATSPCRYRIFAHYFEDARTPSSSSCVLDGGTSCRDGQPCACSVGQTCVANASPAGQSPSGAGACALAPKASLRIFARSGPSPIASVPLEGLVPPDDLVFGSPCQMLHLVDVMWPAKNAPLLADGGKPMPTVVVAGSIDGGRLMNVPTVRYGIRAAGSRTCTADTSVGGVPWLGRQPH